MAFAEGLRRVAEGSRLETFKHSQSAIAVIIALMGRVFLVGASAQLERFSQHYYFNQRALGSAQSTVRQFGGAHDREHRRVTETTS